MHGGRAVNPRKSTTKASNQIPKNNAANQQQQPKWEQTERRLHQIPNNNQRQQPEKEQTECQLHQYPRLITSNNQNGSKWNAGCTTSKITAAQQQVGANGMPVAPLLRPQIHLKPITVTIKAASAGGMVKHATSQFSSTLLVKLRQATFKPPQPRSAPPAGGQSAPMVKLRSTNGQLRHHQVVQYAKSGGTMVI